MVGISVQGMDAPGNSDGSYHIYHIKYTELRHLVFSFLPAFTGIGRTVIEPVSSSIRSRDYYGASAGLEHFSNTL